MHRSENMITIVVLLFLLATNNGGADGDVLESATQKLLQQLNSTLMDAVLFWNRVALQACSNEYDPAFIETLDHPRTSFNWCPFTLIHGAMYKAADFFCDISTSSNSGTKRRNGNACAKEDFATVAIAQAAYHALYELHSGQETMFNIVREAYLEKVREDTTISPDDMDFAIRTGQFVASKQLDQRKNDGSDLPSTYTPVLQPGYHNVDPTAPIQGFSGTTWGNVKPFVLDCVADFIAPDIVGQSVTDRLKFLNSSLYRQSYKEIKAVGELNSTVRTAEQVEIGNFWGYTGGPKVGGFARLLNQVVQVIAIKMKNTLLQNARLFGMVNYAIDDSLVVSFRTKYYYNFWRPVLAIRTGTALTMPDPNWRPLGSPADGNGENFTPNHPSYSSAHAILGGTTFQMLRNFYGTNSMRFTLNSDEYNGETVDSTTGQVRPVRTRRYRSFSQAENEIVDARVYLGIHWRFDGFQAKLQGRRVADYVFNKLN